jgi:hypothetical protein
MIDPNATVQTHTSLGIQPHVQTHTILEETFTSPFVTSGVHYRRQAVLLRKVSGDLHRSVRSCLVFEDTQRSAHPVALVQPIIRHKPGGFLDQRNKALLDFAIDSLAFTGIKLIAANDCVHDGLLLDRVYDGNKLLADS